MGRMLAIALLVVVAALAGCGDDDDEGSDTGASAPESAPAPDTQAAAPAGDCKQAEQPAPEERDAKEPRKALDRGTTYELVFETSCGDFTVTLDQKRAPKTAASLVALAKADFFDGTAFHRIVPDFVIQGGDPTGSGMGGPGYSTRDEPPAGTRYTKGVVAMAKTGTEAPGTAGSQFFVVTADEAPFPSPDYAIVGRVTDGLETVVTIGGLGGPDERPIQPVVVENVSVKES